MLKKVFGLFFFLFFGVLIKNAYAFEPFTATTALAALTAAAGTAGVGYSIWDMFSGKKKKKDVEDPLASIRQELMALAHEGLPAEELKQRTSERFGKARTSGLEDIKEEVYASRQMPGSIHTRLVEDFLSSLSEKEESAYLDIDVANKEYQMKALLGALGAGYPEAPAEEPGLLESLLPAGAEIAGKQFGQQESLRQIEQLIEKLRKQEEGTVPTNVMLSKPQYLSEK